MEIFQKKEINVMKTMKKVALMLCAVLAIGMMAGCGSFDASAYVKAVLDNSYKNDSTGYVDQKIATKEEAEEIYNQGLDQEMDAFISGAGISVSDEIKADFRQLFADLYAATDYTVGESEKQDDGSYKVTVEYKKLKVFAPAYEAYMKELESVDTSSFENEQELYDKVFTVLSDCLKAELANPQYGDTETTTITVSLKDKLYTPNETDLYNLEQALFDIDEMGK